MPAPSVSCDSGRKPDARGICGRCCPSLSHFPRTSDAHFGDGRCPLGAPAFRRHLVFERFARVPTRRRRSQGRRRYRKPVCGCDRRESRPERGSTRKAEACGKRAAKRPGSLPAAACLRSQPALSYALRIGRRYDMAFCGACGYHRGSTSRAKASYGLGRQNFYVSTILRRRERIVPSSRPRFRGRSPAGVQRRNADRSEWLT